MARAPRVLDDRVVKVENFSGLNIREARNDIADKELSDVINFNVGRSGELTKRTGFQQVTGNLGPNSVTLLGFFLTDTYQQFLATYFNAATADYRLLTSPDAVVWTDVGGITGVPQHGVQYVDKFYIVRTGAVGGVVEWSGTAITVMAGSPNGTFCRVFKDRLFVLNSIGAGVVASRLYYSKIANFTATGWPATNYVGVGEGDGDWLIAAINVQDIFVVFKTEGMWILYVQGDPTLWTLRSFNAEIGCISRHTIALFEGLLYFCSAVGVYQTDGNTVRTISQEVSPIFNDLVVSSSSINRASAFIWQEKYVLSLETFAVPPIWNSWAALTWNDLASTPWSGSGSSIKYLVYHIRQKGWTKWAPVGGIQPHVFVSVALNPSLKGVYSGDRQNNGKVYRYGDETYQDNEIDYEVVAETKEFNFGAPTQFKQSRWVGLEQRGAGTVSLTHVADGVTQETITNTPDVEKLELKLRGPGFFRSWRCRVSSTHSNPVTLFGIHVQIRNSRDIVNSRG